MLTDEGVWNGEGAHTSRALESVFLYQLLVGVRGLGNGGKGKVCTHHRQLPGPCHSA